MTCDHKFIDSNRCAKCGWSVATLGAITDAARKLSFSRTESTYTDDTIAVMRDTITALREQVAELRQTNDELRRHAETLLARLDGSPLPEGM